MVDNQTLDCDFYSNELYIYPLLDRLRVYGWYYMYLNHNDDEYPRDYLNDDEYSRDHLYDDEY